MAEHFRLYDKSWWVSCEVRQDDVLPFVPSSPAVVTHPQAVRARLLWPQVTIRSSLATVPRGPHPGGPPPLIGE